MTRINHNRDVASYIRSKLEVNDKFYEDLLHSEDASDLEEPAVNGKFKIGSKLPKLTFGELKKQYQDHPSFTRFNTTLARFLNQSLLAHGLLFPDGQQVQISDTDEASFSLWFTIPFSKYFYSLFRFNI